MSNFFEKWANESKEHQKLVAEESLILDVTEEIHAQMEALGVNRAELAERMGKSKAYVSQLLSGSRNMTLRSLADISFALGLDIPKVVFSELDCATEETDEWRSSDNVIPVRDYRANVALMQPVDENDWIAVQ